jgi:AcrR family transcriptional regulator
LSRDRVLSTALALADRDGLESLTMRKLAAELGVEAMTLYYYVARKRDIIDGIFDLVMGEIEIPTPDRPWKTALRRGAISAHDVLLRHSWAAGEIWTAGPGEARLRYMEGLLARLRDAGFSPAMTHHAYHALDSHIVGFTLWASGYAAVADEMDDVAPTMVQTLDADRFPALIEHIQQHLTPAPDDDRAPEGEFAFGLDLILDGLERILESSRH